MSNGLEDLSREDLLRVLARDRFVKEQLAGRIAGLIAENTELLGVIQELSSNQEVPEEGGVSSPHD